MLEAAAVLEAAARAPGGASAPLTPSARAPAIKPAAAARTDRQAEWFSSLRFMATSARAQLPACAEV